LQEATLTDSQRSGTVEKPIRIHIDVFCSASNRAERGYWIGSMVQSG
jgi:hypothetical protein